MTLQTAGFRLARGGSAALCLVLIVASCLPPIRPDPTLLGCYHLTTDLPGSFADSLGYKLPDVLLLDYTWTGQWYVLPTDMEWHPSWTTYDRLPSTSVRTRRRLDEASMSQRDSAALIPGDSIDVRFPSAIGTLVLRVGGSPAVLDGRAEWVFNFWESTTYEDVTVRMRATSCDSLALALVRTRYR